MASIKNLVGEVIYTSAHADIKSTIEEAVKNNERLVSPDFSNLDLSFLNLNGASFWKASFYNTNLFGSKLSYGSFILSNFEHANLTDAYLTNSEFYHSNFNNSILHGTHFKESSLNMISLNGTNLSNIYWEEANLSVTDWNIRRLKASDLQGVSISKRPTIELRSRFIAGKIKEAAYIMDSNFDNALKILNEIELNSQGEIIIRKFSDNTVLEKDGFEIEEYIRAFEKLLLKTGKQLKENIEYVGNKDNSFLKNELNSISNEILGLSDTFKKNALKQIATFNETLYLKDLIDDEERVMHALRNGNGDLLGF